MEEQQNNYQGIKTISISPSAWGEKKPTLFEGILPWLIILALVGSNLYNAVQITGVVTQVLSTNITSDVILLSAVFFAVVQYLIFVLLMLIYRKMLERVPYFFLVPYQTFLNTFRFWYFVKCAILTLAGLLVMAVPYLGVFSAVVKLVLSFMVVVLSFLSMRKYIDIMFRHLYFRMLVWPWVILQLFILIFFGV